MDTVQIGDLARHIGETVTLRGWLYGKRSGGKIAFLQVRDGTGICQCVVEAAAGPAFETATRIGQESSLILSGTVRRDERSAGGCELAVLTIDVIQDTQDYPIARKQHGIDFLMTHRHLWLRSRRPTAILRIRHTLIRECRNFFDSNGFTLVDTPIIVAGAGEDTQSLFPLEYFDRKAYLAQTGQLYLESACMALGKVYCFGPTFRAEKSKTRRHLTEFWMVEPEIAFAQLEDVIRCAEDLVCHLVESVLRHNENDLVTLGRNLDALRKVRKPFARLTYDEAIRNLRSESTRRQFEERMAADRDRLAAMTRELETLEKQADSLRKQWEKDKALARIQELRDEVHDLEADLQNRPEHLRLAQSFEWGGDLGGSDETILSRQFETPLFVTHYPKQAKAFYMKEAVDNPRVVCNMDLLAPEGYGEIIGGSQREDRLDTVIRNIREKGLQPEDYEWYLDLRRYGTVPHGGFGLGIERTLTWICGLQHVRETIPFPRTMGRLHP